MAGNFAGCLVFIGVLFVVAVVMIDACHTPFDIPGRKKRQTTGSVDEGVFMPACLSNISTRNIQWRGPVLFVIQSIWYEETQLICSAQLGMDTPECWLQAANRLVGRNSPLLEQVKDCIISYTFSTTGQNYTGSRFPSNETEEALDDDLCPDVQDAEFITDFRGSIGQFEMDEDLRAIVDDLESVVDVFQEDIICPSCTCRVLSENVGTLEELDFENTALECNQCWPTRIGSMARRGARLSRNFGLTSIRVDRLRAIDNCEGDFIDLGDATFESELDAQVICEENSITISVDRCTLVNLGLDFVNELVIADRNENFTANTTFDPDCEPELYDNPNFDDIEFSIQNNFDQCGAEIEVNQTHVSYSYFLRANTDDVLRGRISRFGDFCFAIKCTYALNYNVSYDVPLVPLIGKTELELDGGIGQFEVELTLYRDDSFMLPFMAQGEDSPTIEVPDSIYVDISLVNPVQNIRLVVRRCFASNTNAVNQGSSGTYRLIVQRCPEDPLLEIIDEDRDEYRFSFPSFTWIDETLDPLIFINCEVRVCDISGDNCEESDCDKRKKRTVEDEKEIEADKKLIVGPIRLVSSNSCDKNNGGCSHKCIPLKNGHRCECREGYELLEDGKNCIDRSILLSHQSLDTPESKSKDLSSEISFSFDFAFVSLIVFISVIFLLTALKITWNLSRSSCSIVSAPI